LNSDSGLGILDDFAATVISTSALERIKTLAHTHLMRLSVDFHTGKDSGEVLKAIEQASSLNTLLDLILFDIAPILVDLVVAMYYVTHLFDAYMTIIILSIGMAYVWLGFIFTTITQPRRRETSEKERVESATVNETVHNWQTVAYFNREIYEAKRYLEKIRATNTARYAYKIRSKGGNATQDLLVTLGFTATCVFALSQIITGNKPVGNFITFLMYWNTIIRPLQVMSSSYQYAATSLIDAERLLQLLNTKPTVVDCEDAQDLVIETGKVEFKDVGFAYNLRKPVTEKLSFTVKGGQTVALVGETGGGKSTILKLLFRFYDITMGSVLIDNQDLRDVTLSSLRESLGIVPQDSALFNASIRENVRYAKRNATNAEIEEACRAASIHNDIVSFPDGYNTKVGERGVRLSGGQLQRISIARVLLKNPKIVLLDEATSAVDSITEEQIQKAIKRLSKGRTTFVIAHRLSTIMEADQILVIDQGKVSERGTHGELLSMKGKYYELWTKQSVATI
jgi:ABC-type transport system involved in Fe-S cluster assembly fused permease/ATPase subunit